MVDFSDIRVRQRQSIFIILFLQINKRNTSEVSFFEIIKLICSERFMIFFVVFPEFRFLKFFKKYKYFINKMYPKLIGIQISSYYEIRVSANYGTDFKIYSFEIRTLDWRIQQLALQIQTTTPHTCFRSHVSA